MSTRYHLKKRVAVRKKKKPTKANEPAEQYSESGTQSDEDEGSDFEGRSGYRRGGYHPVKVGERYNARYTIEQKLGWGHFSTVWLASDSNVPNDHPHKLVALKIQKSARQYTDAAMDEIQLLTEIAQCGDGDGDGDTIRGPGYIVQLLDHFVIYGPHGKHVCLVFETMGKNLLALIKRYEYEGIPVDMCKVITKQILLGLDLLHTKCSIVHTDLKPENFLLEPLTPFVLEKVQAERRTVCAARRKQEIAQLALGSAVHKALSKTVGGGKRSKEKTATERKQAEGTAETTGKEAQTARKNSEDHDGGPNTADVIATVGKAVAKAQAQLTKKLSKNQRKKLKKKIKKLRARLKDITDQPSAANAAEPTATDTDTTTKDSSNEPHTTNATPSNTDNTAIDNATDNQTDTTGGGDRTEVKEEGTEHEAEEQEGDDVVDEDQAVSNGTEVKGGTDSPAAEGDDKAETKGDEDEVDEPEEAAEALKRRKHESDFNVGVRSIRCKIADLGNACWTHKHFTDDVTTRQYRCPEVIAGYPYGPPIDIWSTACLVFELITGDYLFDPKEDEGGRHSRNEDHLALMMELLGKMPKKLATQGKYSKKMFNRKGELRNIRDLDEWGLRDVLQEKYRMSKEEAGSLADFLLPMLNMNPSDRATAADALASPWLRDVDVNMTVDFTRGPSRRKTKSADKPR